MQPHTSTSVMPRLCGHKAAYTFDRSRNGKDAMMQQSDARKTLCPDCTEKLIGWLSTSETKSFAIELPELKGTPRMIPWARRLRTQVKEKYAPVMQALSENSDDPLARAALAAYNLLFTIESCKFWIDNEMFKYDRWWVSSEISSLVKAEDRFGKTYASYSAYGYYRNWGPQKIHQAIKSINWDADESEMKAVSGL